MQTPTSGNTPRLGVLNALSLGTLLSGCGGEGSPASLPPTARQFTAEVSFTGWRTGILSLSVQDRGAAGTLTLPIAQAAAAFATIIPPGTYVLTGEGILPNAFSVHGTFPDPLGAFTLTGTVPTQTSPGSLALTISGETITGSIPLVDLTNTPMAGEDLAICASTADTPEAQDDSLTGPNGNPVILCNNRRKA